MDYNASIERIYEHLENDDAEKAVMLCLRIARNLQDYLYVAIFLRELLPAREEFIRVMLDDIGHLKKEDHEFLDKTSLERWLETHTLNYSLAVDENGEDMNVLRIGVGEIKSEIEQCERSIEDIQLPSGLGEFDTAAFADRHYDIKAKFRLRIKSINTINTKIKTNCLNYAIKIEKQLQNQKKSEDFLQESYNEVNNFFKAHSNDTYLKLQKASQLVDSKDSEDFSLLLTQVRRAIKSAADFFYPPKSESVKCSDGQERVLGDEQYLNRFQEYLVTKFGKSSSRDLLKTEFAHLAAIARKLNEVASKGVHAEVSMVDAKLGLITLYMFLYNIIVRIQTK